MKNPEKLLDLLSQDARLSTAQLAAMALFALKVAAAHRPRERYRAHRG